MGIEGSRLRFRQQTKPGPRRPCSRPRYHEIGACRSARIPRAPGRMSGSLEPYGALGAVGDPSGRCGARRRGHGLWPAPGGPVPARRDRREERTPRRKGAPQAARGGPPPPDGLDASGRHGGDLYAQRGGGRPARRRGRHAYAGAPWLRPLRGRSVDPARTQAGRADPADRRRDGGAASGGDAGSGDASQVTRGRVAPLPLRRLHRAPREPGCEGAGRAGAARVPPAGAGRVGLLPHLRLLPAPPDLRRPLRQRLRDVDRRPPRRPRPRRAAGGGRPVRLRRSRAAPGGAHLDRLGPPGAPPGSPSSRRRRAVPLRPVARGRDPDRPRGPDARRVPGPPRRGGGERDLLPHGAGAGAARPRRGRLRGVAPRVARSGGPRRGGRAHRPLPVEPRARPLPAPGCARRGPRRGPGRRGARARGPGMIKIDDYREVAPRGTVDLLLRLADRVRGRRFLHISATRFGGGAAEALQRLMLLMSELGLDAGWEIIGGDTEFYATAKAITAALQGEERVLTEEMLEHYLERNRAS